MQRAKHAERKRQTRLKILIGEAAERARALDLDPEEIEAVLAHYIETAGEPGLKAFVSARLRGSLLNADVVGPTTGRAKVSQTKQTDHGGGST